MAKRTSEPFLGTTTDVNKAFPDIAEIDITIAQDPYREFLQHDWQRINRFNKANLPSHVRCCNPRCQQGGLALQNVVEFQPDGEYDFPCNGHEGTPAGRRKGDPCSNRFGVKLIVKRAR